MTRTTRLNFGRPRRRVRTAATRQLVDRLPPRRLPQPFRPAHRPADRQLPGLRARRLLPPDRRRCRSSGAASTSAARSRPATPGNRATRSVAATSTRRAACSSPPTRCSARSISRTGRASRRRVELLPVPWPTMMSAHAPTPMARAQPRRGVASVHADEGARDAAARADRARRRARGSYDFDGRRYLDAVSSWWVNLFGHAQPAHQRRDRGAARRARARDARRLHARAGGRAVRAAGRARAAAASATRSTAPTARRPPRSRSR